MLCKLRAIEWGERPNVSNSRAVFSVGYVPCRIPRTTQAVRRRQNSRRSMFRERDNSLKRHGRGWHACVARWRYSQPRGPGPSLFWWCCWPLFHAGLVWLPPWFFEHVMVGLSVYAIVAVKKDDLHTTQAEEAAGGTSA